LLGFLIDNDDCFGCFGQLGSRDQSGKSRAHNDHVRVVGHAHFSERCSLGDLSFPGSPGRIVDLEVLERIGDVGSA
jgi:hypothetical protein